jgi:hypothetical protein
VATDGYEGLERFADVDSTGEEAMFVSFLERIEQLSDVVARRHRSYELLDNSDGELVADDALHRSRPPPLAMIGDSQVPPS